MAEESTRRIAWRYWLQQIHLWVGLTLCIPLVIIGITGSILVYGHDLEHLFGPPEPRATVTGEQRSADEIIAAARASAPPGMVPGMIRMPDEHGAPAVVRLMRARSQTGTSPAGGQPQASPFAGSIQVLIDPVSLQVLGNPVPAPSWLRFLHDLHGNLLVSGRDGRVAVGWLGVAMLVLGLSGIIIWWPRSGRWITAFTVKKGARGLRLHRDLHGAVGIWSLIVFMVVSFSGVYLAFPAQTGAVINAVFPARDLRAAANAIRVEPIKDATPIGIDLAIALAREAVGASEVRMVFLPMRPDQTMRITLTRPDHVEGAPTITLFIDPWTGRIVDIHDPQKFSVGETIMAWQRPLHYGQGLGEIYKFAVFLSGITIPIFAVTGCAMWLLKRRARRTTALRKLA